MFSQRNSITFVHLAVHKRQFTAFSTPIDVRIFPWVVPSVEKQRSKPPEEEAADTNEIATFARFWSKPILTPDFMIKYPRSKKFGELD